MPLLKVKLEGLELEIGGHGAIASPQEIQDNPRGTTAIALPSAKVFSYGTAALLMALILNPKTHLLLEQTPPAIFARQVLLGNGYRVPEVEVNDGVGDRLAAAALKWDGKEFKPGEPAQCTFFVRAVANEIGLNLTITQTPWDAQYRQPLTLGTVSGLAGLDVYPDGTATWVENLADVRPGDIVLLKGTYTPNWLTTTQAQNALTHVGIAVGNGQMVDRPTRAAPVQRQAIRSQHFAVALRLAGGSQ